jgi:hypothetical protein
MEVVGCTEIILSTAKEMRKKAERAFSNRATAETNMNVTSSRSHAIVIFKCKGASLFLVDLAGAEDQSDTGATGATLRQAASINRSLSELTNVMNALYQKSAFINYRNSRLTSLLKKALGGNSKTSFVLTCNPNPEQLNMSLRTLQFGNRARSLTNNARLVATSSSSDLTDWHSKYDEAMAKMEEQQRIILELQSKLSKAESSSSLEPSSSNKETCENDEEKKNFDSNNTNFASERGTTPSMQRRASIKLHPHDQQHLETLLDKHDEEEDDSGRSSTSTASSLPELILTEAALQRLSIIHKLKEESENDEKKKGSRARAKDSTKACIDDRGAAQRKRAYSCPR